MPRFERWNGIVATYAVRECLLVAFGGVLLAGCGGGQPAVAPVSGVVRLNGKPLASGQVTFWPNSGRSAAGFITADGSFRLTTFRDGDGAPVGENRVTITEATAAASGPPDVDRDQPNRAAERSPIPAKYASPESSGLTFEVKRGQNTAEFDLSAK